jgi:hypothetical protein
VIQAPKPETRIMRYELSDFEWKCAPSLVGRGLGGYGLS